MKSLSRLLQKKHEIVIGTTTVWIASIHSEQKKIFEMTMITVT